jgi:hypothetical protein
MPDASMKTYQRQLLRALEEAHWELVGAIEPPGWWAQAHWRLQRRDAPGRHVFLSFLVDPQSERSDGSAPLIWAVCATPVLPRERPIGHPGEALAWLDMMKGQFAPKLEAFVNDLEASGGEAG